jgi:hypothetical protein
MADPSTDEMVEVLRSAEEGDILKATLEGEPCRLRVIEELSMLFPPRTEGVKTRRVDDDAFRMLYFYLDPETEEPGDDVFARRSFADGFSSEDVDALAFAE